MDHKTPHHRSDNHDPTVLKDLRVRIGHSHDAAVKTGVSVIMPNVAARCAVDVRGGGPGTREISALQDGGLIEHIHGIVLSGGSVYGLAAADAVTAWLGAQGIGYDTGRAGVPVSPIVPSAILFDNANGGNKDWGLHPPFHALGLKACQNLDYALQEGMIGAGFGATAGLYQGGLGVAQEYLPDQTQNQPDKITVMAIIAANPVGSPYMPGTQCPWAWPYEHFNKNDKGDLIGEFGGIRPAQDYKLTPIMDSKLSFLKQAGQSTVIGAIITDARLNQKQLKRLAMMAQDGIAMAVQPAHTPLDGDTIFALSTGDKACDSAPELAALGAAAARCVARALMRGVYFGRMDATS